MKSLPSLGKKFFVQSFVVNDKNYEDFSNLNLISENTGNKDILNKNVSKVELTYYTLYCYSECSNPFILYSFWFCIFLLLLKVGKIYPSRPAQNRVK